jgi:transposase InsO family protein
MLRSFFAIDLICRVLEVSKSSFYAWQRSETYVLKEKKAEKAAVVKEIFDEHRRRYGSRRIVADLQDKGVGIGRYQVRSLMKQQDLVAIQPKSFVPKTTNSQHKMGRSLNLLLNEDGSRKKPVRPYEVVVGDITYIPLENGEFLYLATFQDMYTRVILGWELMGTMPTDLVIRALMKAINRRKLPKCMIIHTDGGGQYASHRFRQLLQAHDLKQSMTRKDNHYDNAMGESFFSRSKAEMLEGGTFANFNDAYSEIFEYIEVYYNKKRRHSGINNDFPERFEKRSLENSISLQN